MESKSILLAHVTGSPNSRQAAKALQNAGSLSACHFSLAWSTPPWWWRSLSSGGRAFFRKRLFPELQGVRLINHPLPEVLRICRSLAGKLGGDRWFSIDKINRIFDEAVARELNTGGATCVYGYFDTSLHTFREAKRLGLRTIYELPTPYWRTTQRLVGLGREARPEWASTLPDPEFFAETGLRRDEELQLADQVIVPSEFVRDSLSEAPPFQASVDIVPYGCPDVAEVDSEQAGSGNGIPLRLLFAGSVSQSKGLGDLLEAIAPLGDLIELRIAGEFAGRVPFKQIKNSQQVRFLGRLPHAKLLEEMRRQDIFVLPTWYEGLSLALLEAMSQGLPVLTTVNSGLAGLIEDGRQGWLVSVGSPDEIRERLERVLSNPSILRPMARAASDWAQMHSWASYRQRLQQALNARL